ncbi:MAG: tetratricopeptide (TPR) repeat protein [Pseudoalteromonas tetraodonis]
MTRLTRVRPFPALTIALLLACTQLCVAQDAAPDIPKSKIATLQKELGQLGGERTSAVRARRACKNIVRDGEALLKASPTAPNRYRVLAIMLQSQKRLLGLDNSERNREALFETCDKLVDAPDEFAGLRLEADLLLSEKSLSLKNADLKERAVALAEIIQRYRDTPGEAKSLKMAALIAPKLEAWELEDEILNTMDDRFMDDPGVIEFRRTYLGASKLDVLFRGSFARTDGSILKFPVDRLGHLCIMVFWSKETQGFEKALEQINAHQELYPGRFDFFSFNVDELPDAGEATLRSMELDWTVLRLPGGRASQAFRTYGQRDPVGIFVNAYGHALLTPNANYGRGGTAATNPFKIDEVRISDQRYLTQLQSLFIGDFLVSKGSPVELIPAAVLDPIQACFAAAPLRYRLTREEALANYQKAEQLCRAAIAQFPKAPDLWRVRDRRIIALMGIWKLAGEPKHLQEAVKEARASLATPLPSGANVVAQFCLAKDALRQSDANPKSVLSALIDATGGADAPGSAHAVAAILALDANSRELHHQHREILLESYTGNPMLWAVVSFLRDRYHRYHLLEANYIRSERRWTRAYLINHGLDTSTASLPDIELKTLDGGTLKLPKDGEGKLTLLMFVEPPAAPDNEFPHKVGGTPAEGRKGASPGVMQYAFEMAERHVHKEVNVVAAFLCDDADRVKKLMEKNAWPCQAAIVPSGLENPLIQQLGVLSADRIPNVFLLRRDGTIAWSISGFEYRSDFGYPFAIRLAMKVHIEVCDTQLAYQALEKGDYQQAARIFSGPFLPEKDERYRWTGPRFHGRALANIGLKDWDTALADIDTAIEAHGKEFDHAKNSPCESMQEMQSVRASILAKLGRADEAEAAQRQAAIPPSEYPETPYELFHKNLGKLRKPQ